MSRLKHAISDYQIVRCVCCQTQENGICGPVTLNILPGIYDEEMYIPYIEGTSTVNSITIQSMSQDSTSVVFENTSFIGEDYIFNIAGGSHIHLKHMTLRNLSNISDIDLIIMSDNASDCSFSYLSLSAINIKGILFLAQQSDTKNLLIEECRFGRSAAQISIKGYNDYSTAENIVVRNNTFEDVADYSIYLKDLQQITISDNRILGKRYYDAISVFQCFGNLQIIRNKINITDGIGIDLDDINTLPESPILIANNFITTPEIGIDVSACTYGKIIHNNINGINLGTGFRMSVNYNFESMQFVNNIINIQDGDYIFNISSLIDENTDFTSDHNVFYSQNQDDFRFRIYGDYYLLDEWQTLYQKDQNSIVANPKYISDDDLHLDNTAAVDGKGLPGTGILTDIDGEIRDPLEPDIGADEITIDLSLIKDLSIESVSQPSLSNCDLPSVIEVLIKNNATAPVDSFSLIYTIFGTKSPPIKVIKRIEPGEVITQKVIDYPFAPNTFYQIEIEVQKPDGQIDDILDNNSMELKYYRIVDTNIKEHRDDCDATTDLSVLKHYDTEILWSTGATTNRINNIVPGNYGVTLTTADGCVISNSINIE